jgi:hypothetical protein
VESSALAKGGKQSFFNLLRPQVLRHQQLEKTREQGSNPCLPATSFPTRFAATVTGKNRDSRVDRRLLRCVAPARQVSLQQWLAGSLTSNCSSNPIEVDARWVAHILEIVTSLGASAFTDIPDR